MRRNCPRPVTRCDRAWFTGSTRTRAVAFSWRKTTPRTPRWRGSSPSGQPEKPTSPWCGANRGPRPAWSPARSPGTPCTASAWPYQTGRARAPRKPHGKSSPPTRSSASSSAGRKPGAPTRSGFTSNIWGTPSRVTGSTAAGPISRAKCSTRGNWPSAIPGRAKSWPLPPRHRPIFPYGLKKKRGES